MGHHRLGRLVNWMLAFLSEIAHHLVIFWTLQIMQLFECCIKGFSKNYISSIISGFENLKGNWTGKRHLLTSNWAPASISIWASFVELITGIKVHWVSELVHFSTTHSQEIGVWSCKSHRTQLQFSKLLGYDGCKCVVLKLSILIVNIPFRRKMFGI